MILGVGVDLIEVTRIRDTFARFGDRFVRRILHESEIAYCLSHRDPAPFLAARFAAKEAISKAFGTGITSELGWTDMEIGKRASGEPFVIMHGAGAELFQRRGAIRLHLSLSHTVHYAIAQAVLEG